MNDDLHPVVSQADMMLRYVARGAVTRIRVEPSDSGSRAVLFEGATEVGTLDAPGSHDVLLRRFKIIAALSLVDKGVLSRRVSYMLDGKALPVEITCDGEIVEVKPTPES